MANAALMSGIYFATFCQMDSTHNDYTTVIEFLDDDFAKLGVTFDLKDIEAIQNSDQDKLQHKVKTLKNRLKSSIENINGRNIAAWFELAFIIRLSINMGREYNRIIESVDDLAKELSIPKNVMDPINKMIISNNVTEAIDEFIKSSQVFISNFNFILNRSDGKKVFIVHGHNNELKETLARFLEKIELDVTILHEKPNMGLSIIEKIESFSDVDFTIVLLSDDDIGGEKHDDYKLLKRRARQNVIFELGFFIGKIGRERVCALYTEGVEIPSDYSGVSYIPIDKSGAWKFQVIKELSAAGCSVNYANII